MASEEEENVLVITDKRTGKEREVKYDKETKAILAMDFRGFKKEEKDFGLLVYDNGYRFTACCSSQISCIDAENGRLFYRGYSIEQLCEQSSFLEVAFLLIHGDLPSSSQFSKWEMKVKNHTYLHENLIQQLSTFRYDAHPMGILISILSSLSTFYPEANPGLQRKPALYQESETTRTKQIYRVLGKLPTIAAYVYLHRIGRPMCSPAPAHSYGYVENFLYMMDRLSDDEYRPNPLLVRVLDKLFILQADHELNTSTATMRQVGSSLADPYTAMAAAAGALYGPHGGAPNDGLIKMLTEIGSEENIGSFLEQVKLKKKVMWGFGSPIYKKAPDPRVKICKSLFEEVVGTFGKRPLIQLAISLVEVTDQDEYFRKRKIIPNINFYTGLIYYAIGFPTDMYPVLFAIPRAVGWLAHWVEGILEKGARIYRPRQIYKGEKERDVPRTESLEVDHLKCLVSSLDPRIQMSFSGSVGPTQNGEDQKEAPPVKPLLRFSQAF